MEIDHISKREQTQGLRNDRIEDSVETISKASDALKTNDQLRQNSITNPYDEDTLTQLRQFLGNDLSDDTLRRAVVLSEPHGEYENSAVKDILLSEKRDKLYEEIDSSAEIIANITEFIKMNEDLISSKTDEELYEMLRIVAFGSNKPTEIEKRFSQQQRRNINLGIINFIQIQKKITDMIESGALINNLEEATGVNPDQVTRIITKPTAVIVYLEDKEFDNLEMRSGVMVKSQGLKIRSTSKNPEISSVADKLIFLRDNNTEQEEKIGTEIVEHELAHNIYQNFFHERINETPFSSQRDLFEQINTISSFDDHKQMAENLFTYFKDNAIDEIIAYSTNETHNISIDALGGKQIANIMRTIASSLAFRTDITDREKSEIYSLWNDEYRNYIDQIRQQKLITQKLMDKVNDPESNMTREKAMALLRMTPPDKFRRLLKYSGIEDNTFDNEISQSQNQSVTTMIKALEKYSNTTSSQDANMSDIIATADETNIQILALANNHPQNLSLLISKTVEYDFFCTIAPTILNSLGESLRYDYPTMSENDLKSIKDTIRKSSENIENSSSPMKPLAKLLAERIICQINEQLLFKQKANRESDDITNIEQALTIIPGEDVEVWNDMIVQIIKAEFHPEHFDDLHSLAKKCPSAKYRKIIVTEMSDVFSKYMHAEEEITPTNKQNIKRMAQALLQNETDLSDTMKKLLYKYMDEIKAMK